ncbi:MAG TPA: OmpA family protein [Puia sp.]|jgi:OOP family OmpA-OmpF porin|nr:OmpA family protein [Puia sp.]
MIRKIVGIVGCLAVLGTPAGAQELGIELNGGLQGTQYQLQNGHVTQLPAGSLGLDYSFRLGNRWDLLTGIIGGLYRTQSSLQDGAVFTYDQVDDAGSAFQFKAKTTGYKETQQFITASIPLLLQYHTAGAGTRWYFDAGGKAFFPLNAGIQLSAKQLSLSGFYPDYNLEVSNLPQHGFGTLSGWKGSTTYELKPAAALSAATGLSFRLSPGTRLYTGLYIDYGLTSLKAKNDSLPLVAYNSAGISKVQVNSVLKTPMAGQMTLLSFGIQARLSFGSARAKPAVRPKTMEEPAQSPDSTLSDDEVEVMQRSVIFGTIGTTSLSEFEKQQLDEVVKVMKQHPAIRISIVGHICNSETETESIKVGAARAKAVARYLRSAGIDRRRMDVSFVSESDPVLPNDPPANYLNRRVVITVE